MNKINKLLPIIKFILNILFIICFCIINMQFFVVASEVFGNSILYTSPLGIYWILQTVIIIQYLYRDKYLTSSIISPYIILYLLLIIYGETDSSRIDLNDYVLLPMSIMSASYFYYKSKCKNK